jgi:fumarate reductase subunit D
MVPTSTGALVLAFGPTCTSIWGSHIETTAAKEDDAVCFLWRGPAAGRLIRVLVLCLLLLLLLLLLLRARVLCLLPAAAVAEVDEVAAVAAVAAVLLLLLLKLTLHCRPCALHRRHCTLRCRHCFTVAAAAALSPLPLHYRNTAAAVTPLHAATSPLQACKLHCRHCCTAAAAAAVTPLALRRRHCTLH